MIVMTSHWRLIPSVLGLFLIFASGCASSNGERLRAGGSPSGAGAGKSPSAGPSLAGPVTPAPDEPTRPADVKGSDEGVSEARLVFDGLGWATTKAGLFVTEDAGSSWKQWTLPVAANAVLGVALLGPSRALLAASGGTNVQVFLTSDAGAAWAKTDLGSIVRGPAAAEFAYLGENVSGLLVARGTSANFSSADWFGTKDSGRSWARSAAPAAGKVSVTPGGAVWIAGGPTRGELFVSLDNGRKWVPVALPPQFPMSKTALDPPVGSIGGISIAVTMQNGEATSVVALASPDNGQSWVETTRTELAESVGAGVTIPTSLGQTAFIVAAPSGAAVSRLPLLGGSARNQLFPRGLPKGITELQFTDDQLGWAEASRTSCDAGKTTCTTTRALVVTRDGGNTWQSTRPVGGG